MSVLTVLVAEEAARPLLFPAPVFGLIALGIFFGRFGIVFPATGIGAGTLIRIAMIEITR
mgnify:CR=1 FL=1